MHAAAFESMIRAAWATGDAGELRRVIGEAAAQMTRGLADEMFTGFAEPGRIAAWAAETEELLRLSLTTRCIAGAAEGLELATAARAAAQQN